MFKPFLLRPSGKNYLWGGQRLNKDYNKGINLSPLAETWECSTHPDGPCFVKSGDFIGQTLSNVLLNNPQFLGNKYSDHSELPILIKFIDADKDLSIQVHPNDAFAKKYEEGQLGKAEMWYVLEASNNAKIIYGLNKHCNAKQIINSISNGTLKKYLQFVSVKRGDVFFISPGTIHAICSGCLIAEIQQSSNLTYRLYDYDRTGIDGKKRELHIDKALRVASLTCAIEPRQPMRVLKYQQGSARELLCRCEYFEVYRMLLNTGRCQEVYYMSDELSFRVLLCISGSCRLIFSDQCLMVNSGDCIFIPAMSEKIRLLGEAIFLDIVG